VIEKCFLEPRLNAEDNPLLVELTKKLEEEFQSKSHSRCIIFVKTRAIARALLTYLSENNKLKNYKLNPKQLTGAGARGENFGKNFDFYQCMYCN